MLVMEMEGDFITAVERMTIGYDGRDDAMRPGGCSHGLLSAC